MVKTISSNNEDYISKLERLRELKEKGILTDNEYNIEKSKALEGQKTTIRNYANNPTPSKIPPTTGAKVFAGLFIVVPFVLFLAWCNSPSDPPKAQPISEMSSEAFTMSQNFVKFNLKSPSTADFSYTNFTSNYTGDSSYTVKSIVDSQNGFGAMIRANYTVIMKYRGGEWADINNWTLIGISIK